MDAIKSRQRGGGALSWLFYLLIGGQLLSFAFKVLPFYMDDRDVNKVVTSLTDRPGASTASVTQVRTWIDKGLQLNMVKLDRNEVKVAATMVWLLLILTMSDVSIFSTTLIWY